MTSPTPEPLPVEFLLERGHCCGNGCFNCPYIDEAGNRHILGETQINQELVDQLQKADQKLSSSS